MFYMFIVKRSAAEGVSIPFLYWSYCYEFGLYLGISYVDNVDGGSKLNNVTSVFEMQFMKRGMKCFWFLRIQNVYMIKKI